jgi:formate hydrogenlyase subunit 6/NADH:ubiquinone oxidoreductase subunit I
VSEEAVYREFIEWFGRGWPLPESDELLPLMKARFSPEEAAFLTGMPHGLTPLEKLAEEREVDAAQLEKQLDALARQGVVYRQASDGEVRYKLSDAFFTFLRSSHWAGRDDQTTRALAPITNRYYRDGFFANWADAHLQGLRALPVEETIADTRQILPYEDVVELVETLDYFTVSFCACKQRKKLDPDAPACDHPDEVCLHFGDLGRYIVENGLGREITREETREILREAAKSGLVHGVSNWLEGVDTICNCCKCCCMWLEGYHVLGHPMSLSPSNYRVRNHDEECKACGLCVKRCPMDVHRLEESPQANNRFGKVSVPSVERCIGCGVCVYTCPVEALTLERCEIIEDPPKDVREFARHFLTDISTAQKRRQQAGARSEKDGSPAEERIRPQAGAVS